MRRQLPSLCSTCSFADPFWSRWSDPENKTISGPVQERAARRRLQELKQSRDSLDYKIAEFETALADAEKRRVQA